MLFSQTSSVWYLLGLDFYEAISQENFFLGVFL